MKLFHAPGSRSNRITWLCAEMGVPLDVEICTFGKPPPELLAVNPCGSFPAVVDGDVSLTESVAAMLYIGAKYGPTPLMVSADEPGYADFLQFAILGEASLLAPINAWMGTTFMAPADQKDNFTTKVILNSIVNRAQLVDRKLQSAEYLAADRFTVADISVAYATGVMIGMVKIGDRLPPSLLDHHARMTARPAYQAACGR